MPYRSITAGETALLRSVFRETLPYSTQHVDTNDGKWGGEKNSITTADTPYISPYYYVGDFADPSVNDNNRWVFVHEMAHVWQYMHNSDPVLNWALNLLDHPFDYKDSYSYDFDTFISLTQYNFEQQASIVADYYYVKKKLTPKKNIGAKKDLLTYEIYMLGVWNSGPPTPPPPIDPGPLFQQY